MYTRSAKYYDKIYSWKDYRKETDKIHNYIRRDKKSHGKDLLDVACGTGNHLTFFKKWYHVEGLDYNRSMLIQARKKHPSLKFFHGNMINFHLPRKYDIITCLFSAIGHLKNNKQLRDTIKNMNHHLKPGGLLVLEASFSPNKWRKGHIGANFVNEPRLKIARMNISERHGNTAILNMHHLIATPKKIEYFVEHMSMQLFKHVEYLDAFQEAGFKVRYDAEGLEGRGLYLGIKPVE